MRELKEKHKYTHIHAFKQGDVQGGGNDKVFVVAVQLLSLTSLWPRSCSTPNFPVLHYLQSFLKLMSVSRRCPPTISYSVIPFSSCPQSFPSGSFPMSQFFTSGGPSTSASVLPIKTQDWFPLGLDRSPCSPKDSQESSLTRQFEGISSSGLSLLCGPALTSIHDYWKNHSFDYMDLCQQSDVSAF